jgi:hypothetical protein
MPSPLTDTERPNSPLMPYVTLSGKDHFRSILSSLTRPNNHSEGVGYSQDYGELT